MNIKQTVQLFKALMQGPASRMELADRANSCPKTVGKVLTELKAQKMIYVIDYSKTTDGRNRVKIYALGDGEDAQPTRPQDQQDRSRKNYLKKLQEQKTFVPTTMFATGKSLWQ